MNASSVILISFVTSALTSGGVYYLADRLMPKEAIVTPQEVTVPGLVGLTEADARTNLAAAGLTMMLGGREPSEDAAAGTVLSQSLPPGTRVAEKQPVSVVLAEALPVVPAVVGKTVAEATLALEESGFSVQVLEPAPHPSVETGLISAQSPEAGAQLKPKRTVTLTPSSGPGVAEVPKVVGLSLGSAKVNIQKAGFKLGRVSWVELAERQGYLVVRQDPAPSEDAMPGAAIDLVVNRGD